MSDSHDIAIIGGGIAGLSAAVFAIERGLRPIIFEKEHWGGLILTEKINQFICEFGPNTIALNKELRSLIDILQINQEVIPTKITKPQHLVYRDHRLFKLPSGLLSLICSSDFSFASKKRIIKSLLVSTPKTLHRDCSLREFGNALFGPEATTKALEPVLKGIIGGDLDGIVARLLAPELFEIVEGGQPLRCYFNARRKRNGPREIVSFCSGIQALTDRMYNFLKEKSVLIADSATRLEPEGDSWKIHCHSTIYKAKRIVVTLSGDPAAELFSPTAPSLSRAYSEVNFVSLRVAHFSSPVAPPPNAFGILSGANDKAIPLGVLFASNLFPNRAPEGQHLYTVCFGGKTHPQIGELSDQEFKALAEGGIVRILGERTLTMLGQKFWPQAIPQYNLQLEMLEREKIEFSKGVPPIFFAGAETGGIGVPNRIKTVHQAIADLRL